MKNTDAPVLLYVDDEIVNLNLFSIMFRGEINVVKAENGDEALKIIHSDSEICAVLSDMKMPGMNGLEFIKKAREIKEGIPYFILSGYDLMEDIQEALDDGLIKGYMQKPFKKDLIKQMIFNEI